MMAQKIALNLVILLMVLEISGALLLNKVKTTTDNFLLAANSTSSQNHEIIGVSSEQLPVEDVSGADLIGVRRYERLVRTKYHQTFNGVTAIEYQTHDLANIVLSYYKTQLAKDDWLLISSQDNHAEFLKNDQQIILKTQTNNGITMLTIIVNPI